MNRFWKKRLPIVLLLSLSGLVARAADKGKEDAARELLQRALKQTNLSLLAPMQLTAKVTMPGKKGDLQFDYVITYVSPNQWRTEWSGKGYSRIIMVNEGKIYRSSSDPVPPLPMLKFEEAVYALSGASPGLPPFISPDVHDAHLEITTKKIGKTPATCVSSPQGGFISLCIDPDSGHSLLHGMSTTTAEYGGYVALGEAQYPESVQLKVDGQLQANAKITIARDFKPPESLFQPLPNSSASDFPGCSAAEQKPVLPRFDKKVWPQYPELARSQHKQGTVTLYAFVAKDGTIQTLRPVGGVSMDLDKAAMDAVNKWTFTPLLYCGETLGHETLITVNFSLSP